MVQKSGPLLCLALLLLPHLAAADATTEAQLRAALQTSTAQIAALEDQVANLQASEAPNVAMIEALRAQLKSGGSSADQAEAKATLAALNQQLATLKAELAKSQAAGAASASAAKAAAATNAALTAQLAATNSSLGSCTTKNADLYKLGNQILDAYAHKDDVFGAFANHEPFIGFKRVQLENIVQNDQDKLYNGQVNPAAPSP